MQPDDGPPPPQTPKEGPMPKVDVHEMTLAEAASAFTVSQATFRRLVSAQLLPAREVKGVRGREWRISVDALERAGYKPRTTGSEPNSEIRRLAEALAAERARSVDLDSQLGYALLTVGRLRARLRELGVSPEEMFGDDLPDSPQGNAHTDS